MLLTLNSYTETQPHNYAGIDNDDEPNKTHTFYVIYVIPMFSLYQVPTKRPCAL